MRLRDGDVSGYVLLHQGENVYRVDLASGVVFGENEDKPNVVAWEIKANAHVILGGASYKLHIRSPHTKVDNNWTNCYYAVFEVAGIEVGGKLPNSDKECPLYGEK